jgi:hypothetical protein
MEQFARHRFNQRDAFEPALVGQMDNERVEARPFFRLENLYHSLFRQSVSRESVHSLCGKRDGFALT